MITGITFKLRQLHRLTSTLPASFTWPLNTLVRLTVIVIDTLPIKIGARTLVGPGVHFYSGTHPLDPAIRNGMQGPELGGAITIEEDCWLAGNVTILPNVRIGRGATVGAGSVVTKVRSRSASQTHQVVEARACRALRPSID